MLILSTWTRVYYTVLILCLAHFFIIAYSISYGSRLTSKSGIKCSTVASLRNKAFIGSFFTHNAGKKGRSLTSNHTSDNAGSLIPDEDKPNANSLTGRLYGCRAFNLGAGSLSEAICEHVEHLSQKVKTNAIVKKIKEGIDIVKTRMTHLSFEEQMGLAALGKLLYVLVLPKFHIIFPFQLIPVNSGLGVDIGFDAVLSVLSFYALMKSMGTPNKPLKLEGSAFVTIPIVSAGLIGSFYLSGYAAQMVDSIMLLLSAIDVPVSMGLQRSMRIFLSHISWVIIGAKMLDYVIPIRSTKSDWFTIDSKELWVYKAIAGYFASCTIYNITDIIFSSLERLSSSSGAYHTEGSDDVDANPLAEPTDIISTIIAAIGPCITAPWWEEMLYRIFVFKTLNTQLPRSIATLLSAIMFSAHHMNHRSALQLFALGVLWSLIEQGTNNVFVSIAVHSLWNSRIMLGSILGL
ncbi:hypothetical protein BgAZ_101700 [Babesia gibsoni]|uniref:CAAX prenyl protease 2/Lysostaphin resistance protein A-like domain-containing protein n=1 Tax=Babesia gibsoni TaxID=33632 RepID=A0AAD8PFB3_BABGI|nr:hypothetical protein BgAZ_101700 [Babesia gibsoni]